MGRKRRIYTDDFKMKCIGELLDGKTTDEVCRENGISFSALSAWKEAVLEAAFADDEIEELKKRQKEIEAQLEKLSVSLERRSGRQKS